MEKSSSRVINGLYWRFLERSGAQGVSFVVSIVLARLLNPTIYGVVALVTVFTTILQVFVDSGLANALIQKKDVDNVDFSTVFFFNVVACIILYVLLFFAAPYVALFYQLPKLTALIRVMSLSLIISGVKNVQQAFVSRKMIFKKFFFATLGGTIGAAAIGIVMALYGFGVWALVAQNLFNMTVDTVILWITVKWRPQLVFSWDRLKSLFSFGWKLLTAAIIDTVYKDFRSLVIGKMYATENLAFYNRGQKFPELIVSNINASIDSVLLPAMSASQDDKERVKAMTQRSIKISSYIMMPIMVGLAVCAEPLIRLLLTEKWLSSVFFMRIFCFTYAFYPIHTANLNAIKAVGRSDIYLKLEIIKKIIGMILLLATMWISVKAMAYSLLISTITGQIINSWPNKKLLGYRYVEQIKDILPHLLLSCVIGLFVFCVSFFALSDVITLLIQVVTAIVIYVSASIILKIDSYLYIKNSMISYFNNKAANRRNREAY